MVPRDADDGGGPIGCLPRPVSAPAQIGDYDTRRTRQVTR